MPRFVPSHTSAPAPVAVECASRLQEFPPWHAEQLRQWVLSRRAPWPQSGTAHRATRCYRLRSGPKHQVRASQTSPFFWRAVFAPHFPLAVSMLNSASAILRATFSSQSKCSVMILASLWRGTDVLISCPWGDDTRHPATPVAEDIKVAHGSNSTLNSSSFVNASSSPRSKLSQCRILRGLVLSEDTFNSSVLTNKFTLLSVSARMLSPIISCVSTVAPSNFLLLLMHWDAPSWTSAARRLEKVFTSATEISERCSLVLCAFTVISSWPLVFRPRSAAMFDDTVIADACTLLSVTHLEPKRQSLSECGISEAMFRCCWWPTRDKNGQVEYPQCVCICVCLFVCVCLPRHLPPTDAVDQRSFSIWGLGPATTISILTSGLEHKHWPEFKPNKVKSTHKWAQSKQQTSKLNRVTPAQESDSADEAHAHPRTLPLKWFLVLGHRSIHVDHHHLEVSLALYKRRCGRKSWAMGGPRSKNKIIVVDLSTHLKKLLVCHRCVLLTSLEGASRWSFWDLSQAWSEDPATNLEMMRSCRCVIFMYVFWASWRLGLLLDTQSRQLFVSLPASLQNSWNVWLPFVLIIFYGSGMKVFSRVCKRKESVKVKINIVLDPIIKEEYDYFRIVLDPIIKEEYDYFRWFDSHLYWLTLVGRDWVGRNSRLDFEHWLIGSKTRVSTPRNINWIEKWFPFFQNLSKSDKRWFSQNSSISKNFTNY